MKTKEVWIDESTVLEKLGELEEKLDRISIYDEKVLEKLEKIEEEKKKILRLYEMSNFENFRE